MCVYVLFTCQIFVKFLWICNFQEWGKKKRREEKAFQHRLLLPRSELTYPRKVGPRPKQSLHVFALQLVHWRNETSQTFDFSMSVFCLPAVWRKNLLIFKLTDADSLTEYKLYVTD